MSLIDVLEKNRIIPVCVVSTVEQSLRLAEMLLENSLPIIEITMRTDSALAALEAIAARYPELTVGAGSILSREALTSARDSGASFAVAPVFDETVALHARSLSMDFIPGIATPSELNKALQYSAIIKLFPASSLGGPSYIKSMIAPFKIKKFHLVPTGGVDENNYTEYLSTEKVLAVGMSYPVDKGLLDNNDFGTMAQRIKRLLAGLP